MASVRICGHLREGGEPIGLAEVGDVSQGSLELPDFSFSLPICLVMARRSHNVFDSMVLSVCFQNLEVNRGSASLTIEVGTP